MKRRFWMLLVVLMGVSLTLPGCAAESAEGQVMLPEDSARILQKYSVEIDYVADCTGVPITEIDYDAVQRIRDVQVNWENQYPAPTGDSRMEELVTEIVDAILVYKSMMDNRPGNGTLAIGTTVNHKRTRVNELPMDLRGECVCELSVGGSATIENGMSLSVGTSIQLGKVYTLDVAFNIQKTFSRSYTGPTGNEYFEDGKLITHHIMFKVLEGHLVYHEYDYINEYGTVTHFAEYEVEEATAKVMPHTAYVSDGGPGLYVMSEDRSTVKHYDGWYQAEADIETNPAQFH